MRANGVGLGGGRVSPRPLGVRSSRGKRRIAREMRVLFLSLVGLCSLCVPGPRQPHATATLHATIARALVHNTPSHVPARHPLASPLRTRSSLFVPARVAPAVYAAGGSAWNYGVPLPAALARPAVAVGQDGLIYVFGGFVSGGAVSHATYIYNPGANAWSQGAPLPTAREGTQAVTLPDGRIAVLGGGSGCQTNLCWDGSVYRTVEVYSPSTNSWGTLPPMPTPRYRFAAVSYRGRLYAIGGSDGRTVLAGVESYDPASNRWGRAPSLPLAEEGAAAAVDPVSDGIYLSGGLNVTTQHDPVGGVGDRGRVYTTVYRYDGGAWSARAPLPQSAQDHAATLGPDGRIYAVGGYSGGLLTTVQAYDPRADRWSLVAPLPAAHCCGGIVTAPDGHIYVIGSFGPVAQVLVYGPLVAVSSARGSGASSLKWFPNTPDNGFQMVKGDEFQLAALDPNDNDRAIRRVVFFAKWPRSGWKKLRCDGPNHGPTRTRPSYLFHGDANDTLYTCDVIDTVTDAGQVQFSFDVDGPVSRVTTHPDGIRTGQNNPPRSCYTSSCGPNTNGSFGPHDFQRAYSVPGDARGVNIGIILGGVPLSPADLAVFAFNTRTTRLRTGSGPDTVEWRFIGSIASHRGGNNDDTRKELAMDVEYAHAMAPGSHLIVWLLPITSTGTPDSFELAEAVREATRARVRVVSVSFNIPSLPSQLADPSPKASPEGYRAFYRDIEDALHAGAHAGTTFFFDSGDDGQYSGCQDNAGSTCPQRNGQPIPLPAFPAESQYVVAVGGTNMTRNPGASPPFDERAWGAYPGGIRDTGFLGDKNDQSSGAGCSQYERTRPSWQRGTGAAHCKGRAVPDVAAFAVGYTNTDIHHSAYIVSGGSDYTDAGGTSLATPLWAGMAADLQHYLMLHHKPAAPFMARGLYRLANNAITGPRDFHDITAWGPNEDKGNGFPVGKGWDEVTGWGSPNLAHLEEDWAATDGGTHFATPPQSGAPTQNTTTPIPGTRGLQPTPTPLPQSNPKPTVGGALLAIHPFPGRPLLSALDTSRGELFVTHREGPFLSVVEAATGATLRTVAIGPVPSGFRTFNVIIAPRQGLVAVTLTPLQSFDFAQRHSWASGYLALLDPATLQVRRLITLPFAPQSNIELDPGRGYLYLGGTHIGDAVLASISLPDGGMRYETTIGHSNSAADVGVSLDPTSDRLIDESGTLTQLREASTGRVIALLSATDNILMLPGTGHALSLGLKTVGLVSLADGHSLGETTVPDTLALAINLLIDDPADGVVIAGYVKTDHGIYAGYDVVIIDRASGRVLHILPDPGFHLDADDPIAALDPITGHVILFYSAWDESSMLDVPTACRLASLDPRRAKLNSGVHSGGWYFGECGPGDVVVLPSARRVLVLSNGRYTHSSTGHYADAGPGQTLLFDLDRVEHAP